MKHLMLTYVLLNQEGQACTCFKQNWSHSLTQMVSVGGIKERDAFILYII